MLTTRFSSSKVLGQLKLHQQLFEEGLQEAFSTEMIIAFNDLDRERQEDRRFHETVEEHIYRFESTGTQQDEKYAAFLEAQMAIKAGEKAKKAAIREANVKKAMSKCRVPLQILQADLTMCS